MAYNLGNVKPHVAAAANEVGPKFGIRTVYGYSYRNIAGTNTLSDHARGLALDFMCDIATGDQVAAYLQQNASRLHVTYIIHNRRIWSVARSREGWRAYTGVNPHTDHVHVSFETTGSYSAPTENTSSSTVKPAGFPDVPPLPHVPNPLDLGKDAAGAAKDAAGSIKDMYQALSAISKAFAFLFNPNSWTRVLMFLAGLMLLTTAIASLVKSQSAGDAAKGIAKTATRAAVRTTKKAVTTNAG